MPWLHGSRSYCPITRTIATFGSPFAKEAERIKNSVSAVDREYVTRQIDTLGIEILMLRLGRLR